MPDELQACQTSRRADDARRAAGLRPPRRCIRLMAHAVASAGPVASRRHLSSRSLPARSTRFRLPRSDCLPPPQPPPHAKEKSGQIRRIRRRSACFACRQGTGSRHKTRLAARWGGAVTCLARWPSILSCISVWLREERSFMSVAFTVRFRSAVRISFSTSPAVFTVDTVRSPTCRHAPPAHHLPLRVTHARTHEHARTHARTH